MTTQTESKRRAKSCLGQCTFFSFGKAAASLAFFSTQGQAARCKFQKKFLERLTRNWLSFETAPRLLSTRPLLAAVAALHIRLAQKKFLISCTQLLYWLIHNFFWKSSGKRANFRSSTRTQSKDSFSVTFGLKRALCSSSLSTRDQKSFRAVTLASLWSLAKARFLYLPYCDTQMCRSVCSPLQFSFLCCVETPFFAKFGGVEDFFFAQSETIFKFIQLLSSSRRRLCHALYIMNR